MPVIDPQDIHSLSEFQRNAKDHIRKMKRTRRPVVLTVNGRAAVVIQDIESYSKASGERAREAEIAAVLEGLAQARAGLGRPIEVLDREFRARRLGAKKSRRKSA